jgi:outer membrane immunogenic protein
MKRIFIGLVIAAATAGAAAAADLASAPYTKAAAMSPGYNWSGWYVGGNAGYAWGKSDPSTTTEFTPTNYWNVLSVPQVNAAGVGPRLNTSGFVGGGQFGYNYQAGNVVWGAETDFESFKLKGSRFGGAAYACCAGSFTLGQTTSTDWLFTLRGRLGWAANNLLLYATGGLAVTNLKYGEVFVDTFGANEAVNYSKTKAGWTVGAGAEYGIDKNWTVKAEYLYLDFGSLSGTSLLGPVAVTGACNCTRMFHSTDLTAGVARLGVNYRFGGS